jgi:hypothetical protein
MNGKAIWRLESHSGFFETHVKDQELWAIPIIRMSTVKSVEEMNATLIMKMDRFAFAQQENASPVMRLWKLYFEVCRPITSAYP